MTFLRSRRTFADRFDMIQKAGELFLPDTPVTCDKDRTKVGVSIGGKGRMKSVSIFYKHAPKELTLDILSNPHVRIL